MNNAGVYELFEEIRDLINQVIDGQIVLRSAWINSNDNLVVAYHSNDDGYEYDMELGLEMED